MFRASLGGWSCVVGVEVVGEVLLWIGIGAWVVVQWQYQGFVESSRAAPGEGCEGAGGCEEEVGAEGAVLGADGEAVGCRRGGRGCFGHVEGRV